eukprot:CAMPEP_0185261194 /NCGR_PEP_ID=MMETSP1359-20130426/9635_1 /TAXON_ID=552665 /ORGANISM="Bigelowiella longifila, Strain CCMP242" /LENGTH=70 /DNA_ID=CAMNT_0027847723 /DNA_START=75 /DNA_END=283 /DNA_ORIENTATION=-
MTMLDGRTQIDVQDDYNDDDNDDNFTLDCWPASINVLASVINTTTTTPTTSIITSSFHFSQPHFPVYQPT